MTSSICNKLKCTGCTSCASICPKNAIHMQENSEGFLYPVIDEGLCVDCDLCRKVCPANGFAFTHPTEPDCYAVMASDKMRRGSSSGAFFPVLALHVLEQGGHVCGAAFDENMVLRHRIVSRMEDLDCLRGSKYLQSSLGDTFRQVKVLLEKGDLVLFTGTPCQIAGLTSFLKKDWDNLITADLICHGVPSQKVFDNYLASEFPGEKVLHTEFRDKRDGWGNGYLTTTRATVSERSLKDSNDSFLQAFFANVSLRECCYGCSYACMPRTGDFTMADFWGVPKEMDDRKGTSLIFLNSPKAAQIWQTIRPAFMKVKKYPASLPVRIQPRLRHGSERHPAREDFFKEIAMGTALKKVLQNTIYSPKNVALLNYHWENVNFGAVLTSYALNVYLNEQGYFAQNINYIPSFPWIEEEPENPFFDAFRRKYIPMTRLYRSGESLADLNESFSSFIVGSDQVWRHGFIRDDKDAYFFSFASPDKKLMAYAASFGTAELDADDYEKNDYAQRLALFDLLAIREDSGVSICHDLGSEATQVIDPVFLLTQEHWKVLADEGTHADSEHAVVYYTINEKLAETIEEFIATNSLLASCGAPRNITFDLGIEEWLHRVQNCRFFVTDSYHGSCFAILFNKPFVCVNTNKGTQTRMASLFESLGIEGRLYSSFDEVPLEKLVSEEIDYASVNEKLEVLRLASSRLLLEALEKPLSKERIEEKTAAKTQWLNSRYADAVAHKGSVLLKYLRYKILSKITFGRKRKNYKAKSKKMKARYKAYKNIIKNHDKAD